MANSNTENGFPAPVKIGFCGPEYECGVCGDSFRPWGGKALCKNHFYCYDCVMDVFDRSLLSINEFPISCCALTRGGIDIALLEPWVDESEMNKYLLKLAEYKTPVTERVYCADPDCAVFLPADQHVRTRNLEYVAVCRRCGTDTCVSCKGKWHRIHKCPREETPRDGPPVKPDWLPDYSADCRTKQCPSCREWIQLSAACNHMTCNLCNHQWCFICLLPWVKQHDGCPVYGDPKEGYDERNVERTQRELHLYTGRDSYGYDRRGVDKFGKYIDGTIAPPESPQAHGIFDLNPVDLDFWEHAMENLGLRQR